MSRGGRTIFQSLIIYWKLFTKKFLWKFIYRAQFGSQADFPETPDGAHWLALNDCGRLAGLSPGSLLIERALSWRAVINFEYNHLKALFNSDEARRRIHTAFKGWLTHCYSYDSFMMGRMWWVIAWEALCITKSHSSEEVAVARMVLPIHSLKHRRRASRADGERLPESRAAIHSAHPLASSSYCELFSRPQTVRNLKQFA